MAIPFINARIFFGGYELTSHSNQISLGYEAEALDETTFSDTTRKMRGGLKRATVAGGGYIAFGDAKPDPVLFDSIDLMDAVVMLAAEQLAEGSTSSGFMYGLKTDLLRYSPMGQQVGEIQAFSFAAECRGV